MSTRILPFFLGYASLWRKRRILVDAETLDNVLEKRHTATPCILMTRNLSDIRSVRWIDPRETRR
jgi:hypothetical protein